MDTRYSPSTGNFYPLDIDYTSLPNDVIIVSAEDYAAAMARPAGHSFAFVDGKLVIDAPPAPSLPDVKAAKLAEINAACANRLSAIKEGYPPDEVATWVEQKAEAIAYTRDNATPTPLLSAMASARGITVADLAARVTANAAAWAVACGETIGKRQRYEDALNAAKDVASVAAVVWQD